jgi:hypothetical protein
MIVVKLIEQDLEIVEDRVPENTMTYSPADITAISNAERARLAKVARDRMRSRLEYVRDSVESGRFMATEELARIQQVEERAKNADR